jgi:peptidoglycan hydrolase CwlO-like protein
LKKKWLFALCLAVLIISCVFVDYDATGEKPKAALAPYQVAPQQTQSADNVSRIENLTAQIPELERQISELNRALTQKEIENSNLKQRVQDYQDSLNQIMSELRSLEQIDQIREVVERLRIEPPSSTLLP